LAVKSGELDTALSRDTANSNDKVDNYDIRALKEKVDENAEMARVIGEISNNLVNLAWKEKLDKAEAEKAQANAVLKDKTATTEEKLAAAQSLQQANEVIGTYGKGG
ncbi:hypothetical protein RYD26_12760, partial [Pasteurellaceae bacterium LIM206]|nr:hypothetical protein [Pasteurellaceae bacterium LIM206]